MQRLSLWFFLVAAIYGIVGMLWGVEMAISGNHAQYPAHAHLTAMGWVSMSIYGIFFALAGNRVTEGMAQVVFWLANAGVILLVPAMALITSQTGAPLSIVVALLGQVFSLMALAIFGYLVFDVLRNSA